MAIIFDNGETSFKHHNTKFIKQWIKQVIQAESKKPGDLAIVFTSDDYLLQINKQYLNHDYYTDIITFDYSEFPMVSGDLLISIDRVRENAELLNIGFDNELYRVIVHGVLHLCGYGDKSDAEELNMRSKENFYLELIPLA
jgi:rRNA maturation RNase YbeY